MTAAKNTLLTVFVALFVSVSLGGVFLSQITMDDNAMHDCPFMGLPALCDMSPLAHLSQWQSTFAATVQNLLTLLLCVVLAMLFVAYVRIKTPLSLSRLRYAERTGRLIDPHALALRRGILNTKAY